MKEEKKTLQRIKAIKTAGGRYGHGVNNDMRDIMHGKDLYVLIKSARGLLSADPSGASDPFCRMKVGEHASFRTRIIPRTTEPPWNETKVVREEDLIQQDLSGQEWKLEFCVYDHDVWKNDKLGKAVLELSSLLDDFRNNRHTARSLELVEKIKCDKPGLGRVAEDDAAAEQRSPAANGSKLFPGRKQMLKMFKSSSPAAHRGFLDVELWLEPATTPAGEERDLAEGGRVITSVLRMPHASRGSSKSICMEVTNCGTLYEEPFVVYYKVTLFSVMNLDYQTLYTAATRQAFNMGASPAATPRGSIQGPSEGADELQAAVDALVTNGDEDDEHNLLSFDSLEGLASDPSGDDTTPTGLYIWIKVVCNNSKQHTHMYSVPKSGHVNINFPAIFSDVRPVKRDPSVVFCLYVTTDKRDRGRNIANTDISLKHLLDDCERSAPPNSNGTPFPVHFNVEFNPLPGSTLAAPMQAGLQAHAGVADHDLRAHIHYISDILSGHDGQTLPLPLLPSDSNASSVASSARDVPLSEAPTPRRTSSTNGEIALNSAATSIVLGSPAPSSVGTSATPRVLQRIGSVLGGQGIFKSLRKRKLGLKGSQGPPAELASSDHDPFVLARQQVDFKAQEQQGPSVEPAPQQEEEEEEEEEELSDDSEQLETRESDARSSALGSKTLLLRGVRRRKRRTLSFDLDRQLEGDAPTNTTWVLAVLQLVWAYMQQYVQRLKGKSIPEPPRAAGTVTILLRNFEVLAPHSGILQTTYCLALKCGPHWWVTQPRSRSSEIRWEVVLPLYDPSCILSIVLLSQQVTAGKAFKLQREKQVSIVGRARMRLAELPINTAQDVVLDVKGFVKGKLECTGTVDLRVCIHATVTDLLRAYIKPSKPYNFYALGFPAEVNALWEVLRQRDLQERLDLLGRKSMEAVLSTGRQKFTTQRIKAHYNRIMVLLAPAELSKAGLEFQDRVRSWEEPFLTGGAALGIVLLCKFTSLVICAGLAGLVGRTIHRFHTEFPAPLRVDLELQTMAPAVDEPSNDDSSSQDPKASEVPITNKYKALKKKYDVYKSIMLKVQNGCDDVATIVEKISMLLSWQDPRVTMLMLLVSLIAVPVLWFLGLSNLIMLGMLWHIRHPRLRTPTPPPPACIFAMLPSKSHTRV